MSVQKLYNKFCYYKAMAEKRPVSVFCNARPSIFLQNYLIYKERAAYLLESCKGLTENEKAMLHEILGLENKCNGEAARHVKSEWYNLSSSFRAVQ